MEVRIRRFANLVDYGPPEVRGGVARVELPEGATIRELVSRLGIPDDVPRLLLVNGCDAGPATRLRPGDVVELLPLLVGG